MYVLSSQSGTMEWLYKESWKSWRMHYHLVFPLDYFCALWVHYYFGFFLSIFSSRRFFLRGFFPWACWPHTLNKFYFHLAALNFSVLLSWVYLMLYLIFSSCIYIAWLQFRCELCRLFGLVVNCAGSGVLVQLLCFPVAVYCLPFPKLYQLWWSGVAMQCMHPLARGIIVV